jgi:Arc/MetJ family transcription regulator
MRINIVIDDKLLMEAQRLSGIKTKKEIVEEALKIFIGLNGQKEIRRLRGKVKWEGNLRGSRIAG